MHSTGTLLLSALARYVKLAKMKKTEKVEERSETVMVCITLTYVSPYYEVFFLISVGRMKHSREHQRGVLDRAFISRKCFF